MTTHPSIETLEHPYLRKLMADVEAVTAEAERLHATLSEAQCVWKPDPGVWNVAECFHHLIVTGELYHPRIQAAIEAAPRDGRERAFRPSLFGKWFLGFLSPDSKRKVKTFRAFEPSPALQDGTMVQRFVEQQEELTALIRQADAVNLNAGKFASPVTRLLRFSVGEGLTVVVVHQQRHLQQARRLTQHADFPNAASA